MEEGKDRRIRIGGIAERVNKCKYGGRKVERRAQAE
jgi:hypothetical protein